MPVGPALLGGARALVVSLLLAPVVLNVLTRRRVLDHPSDRSSHVTPVPRGGGLAPAVGALVALAVASPLRVADRWGLGAVAALFACIGLAEDLKGIGSLRRLALQFVVAGAAGLLLLQDMTGPMLGRCLFVAGAMFCLVGYTNAYNFMDGIDGISVVQAVAAGAAWFAVGASTDVPALTAGGAIIAGAALGFAPYNMPRARVFLGDVGSYFIGAWLAAVAILGVRAGVAPEAVIAPLAVYLADTATTLVRRIVRGERWYLPHREHVYQRLIDLGWSHMRTSAFVGGCIAVCCALGAISLGDSLPARVAADATIAGVVGAYLTAPKWLAHRTSSVAVA